MTYADVILSCVSECMNRSGPVWLFLSECGVVPCFTWRARHVPHLQIHHCPRLQKAITRKMEEDYVETTRKSHSSRNGVACFSCRSVGPLSEQLVIRQDQSVYLEVVCHQFSSVTLSPLWVCCTRKT